MAVYRSKDPNGKSSALTMADFATAFISHADDGANWDAMVRVRAISLQHTPACFRRNPAAVTRISPSSRSTSGAEDTARPSPR